jgi:amidase
MVTFDRRSFIRYSALAGAGATATVLGAACTRDPSVQAATTTTSADMDFRWSETSIADLQAAMTSGEATALSITEDHIDRIERMDWSGPQVNSIIEINPDAVAIAEELDRERTEGNVRSPLHGIPIVLKDSIATADAMETTAGSLALLGAKVPRDAGVVTRLREAGAIILGKANMSEWNAFRGWPLHGGWSARAGMGVNPYVLNYSTGDSSSGSAAAVAASFAAGAIGLETYGSIVMPSSLCSVVGLFPTRGLIGRSGTIPISFSRDALGPMARSVADLAAMLNVLVGPDPLDPASAGSADRIPPDFTSVLDPDGLRGARLGVWRQHHLWHDEATAKVIDDVLPLFQEQGAELIDPVVLPHWEESTGEHIGVMFSEFEEGIRRYLSGLSNTEIRTLADVVAFNEAHPDQELRWHSQGTMESCVGSAPIPNADYLRSRRLSEELARADFTATLRDRGLDAILAPTFITPWPIDLFGSDPLTNGNGVAGPSNAAGFPNLTVPAGYAGPLPVGISFLGWAWDEPTLLKLGFAFEQAVQARRAPRFIEGYGVRTFVDRDGATVA